MADSNAHTPPDVRIYQRGKEFKFRISFYEDQAQSVPILPLDNTQFPSYTIYNPLNNLIQSGVGQLEGQGGGDYYTSFFIPNDATLSNDDYRWRIHWTMVSNTNRQVEYVVEFDVYDEIVTATQSRDQQKVALVNEPIRIFNRMTSIPSSLQLKLFDANGAAKFLDVSLSSGKILGPVEDGDSKIFYVDIKNGLPTGCYTVIWTIQENSFAQYNTEYEKLIVLPIEILQHVPSLRMLIDKLQKRASHGQSVWAYEDSDCFEYLFEGLNMVNGYFPPSEYYVSNVPGALQPYWIMASAWWGLQAQHLLATDLHFTFSGQTVTLDVDIISGLDSAMGRFAEMLNTVLPKLKMQLYRQARPVGVVAGRPYSIWNYRNFVYRVNSPAGGVTSILNLITQLGLT